jgi:hypothetical protein
MAQVDKEAKNGARSGGLSPERQRMLRVALGVGVGGLVIILLSWWGCVRLWDWIANMEEFRVYPGNLALEPVSWMDTEALREDILRTDPTETGVLKYGWSFFSPNLTDDVARAYATSPWVRQVVGVRRHFPNSLEVRLILRSPYATVRSGQGRMVVDDEGVVLTPQIYHVGKDEIKRPEILLSYAPEVSPKAGARWNCEGVAAGIEMLNFIEQQPILKALNIQAVEVRREGSRQNKSQLCIVLRPEGGPEIRWGLPPKSDIVNASEVSTPIKLAALLTILNSKGEDLPHVEYIDLRWDRPILRPRGLTPSGKPIPTVPKKAA